MECSCGWVGVVWDCEPDVDGDGSLGCPECFKVVKIKDSDDIIVTDIFDDTGRQVSKVVKCDCKSSLTWIDFIIGTLGALITIAIISVV